MNKRIYRIIDANIDRAREGLRVVEDTLRFFFDKKELTERIRNLRQEIPNLPSLLSIPLHKLLASREIEKDIGRIREEKERKNPVELISSNLSRVEESMRVLEEYSRILNPKATPHIKKMRFEVYHLQKMIHLAIYRGGLTSRLGIYIITDKEIAGRPHEEIARLAINGGADTIQLRDKKNSTLQMYEEAKKIRKIIPKEKALFIVNDRVEIAVASDADGVHLGKDDLSIHEARKIIGEDKIIGFSCDNLDEAVKAEKEGADYISLGPIFSTITKKDLPAPLGIKVIKEAKKRISIPLVAIGGIDETNMKEVVKEGANSIAILSAVLKYEDITERVRNLKEKFLSFRSF